MNEKLSFIVRITLKHFSIGFSFTIPSTDAIIHLSVLSEAAPHLYINFGIGRDITDAEQDQSNKSCSRYSFSFSPGFSLNLSAAMIF